MSEEDVLSGVIDVARYMAISAKTAPKARGVDNIVVSIITDKETLSKLADKMDEMAGELGEYMSRDANNVRNSQAVVLIGAKVVNIRLKGPPEYKIDINEAFSLVNLGIAVGSAVKTAALLNVDNRIMFSVGIAAQRLGLINADYVLGIPLSVSSKNIYFDRK